MSSADTKAIRDAYFNACNFESLMRGIHFAVAWTALVNIYTGQLRHRRHTHALLVLAMFTMSTIHNATFWAYVRRAFITHGDTSASVAAALDEYPDWFTGTTSVSDLNAVLADGILIWRVWTVWGRNWVIIVAPLATTLMTLAFSIVATYGTVSSTTFGAVGVDYATALYSTSLATTILCTGLIVYQIIRVTGYGTGGAWKGLHTYRTVTEILVESAALYCVATLFALLAYIYSGVASEYASAFWTSVTGIAPTLIIARVASGESRPDDTWREGTSGMSFRSSALRINLHHASSGNTPNELDVMRFEPHISTGIGMEDDLETSSALVSTLKGSETKRRVHDELEV